MKRTFAVLSFAVGLVFLVNRTPKQTVPEEEQRKLDVIHGVLPVPRAVVGSRQTAVERSEEKRPLHPLVHYSNPGSIRSFDDQKLEEAFDVYLSLWGSERHQHQLGGSAFDTSQNLAKALMTLRGKASHALDRRRTRERLLAMTLAAQSQLPEATSQRKALLDEWSRTVRNADKAHAPHVASDFEFFLMMTPRDGLADVAQRLRDEKDERIRKIVLRGAYQSAQREGLSEAGIQERLVAVGFERSAIQRGNDE